MYRKTQDIIHINIVFDSGGLGDLVGSLPCINYIYQMHKHVVIHLWLPVYGIDLAKRSLPDDPNRIIIKSFLEKEKFRKDFFGRAFTVHKSTNLGYHTTKQAYAVLINEEVEDKHLNYLPVRTDDIDISKFNLPEKYIILTTGFTAPVREFLPEYINEVVDYTKKKDYEVVFLGKKESPNGAGHVIKGNFKTEINYSAGIDLIDKTTLPEAQKIMSQSKCVVGLDNGLLHLAATSEVPIVFSFTSVKPEHRLPYRHDTRGWNCYSVVPPESLACRFCQSNWQFTYYNDTPKKKQHDFKRCYYVERKEDFEIRCIKMLTPMLYINELEKIL